jgi:hypothetical protein
VLISKKEGKNKMALKNRSLKELMENLRKEMQTCSETGLYVLCGLFRSRRSCFLLSLSLSSSHLETPVKERTSGNNHIYVGLDVCTKLPSQILHPDQIGSFTVQEQMRSFLVPSYLLRLLLPLQLLLLL